MNIEEGCIYSETPNQRAYALTLKDDVLNDEIVNRPASDAADGHFIPDYRIPGLADGVVETINFATQGNLNTLFFLDKSARPAAHLFRKVWHGIYPKRRMPDTRYINIGGEEADFYYMEKMFELGMQRTSGEEFASPVVQKLVEQTLPAIRHWRKRRDISTTYNLPAGACIGIIDEVCGTGKSLEAADFALRRSFPQAGKISTWEMFSEKPPWFNKSELIGVEDTPNRHWDSPPPHVIKPLSLKHKDGNKHLLFRKELSEIAQSIVRSIALQ